MKVLSSKVVNRDAFMGVMGRVWQMSDGVEIEFVSSNVIMFHFKNMEDHNRVLNGGPWTFDGAFIVMVIPTGKGDIEAIGLYSVEFWVQIHRVPLLCRTKEIGWFLGGLVGELVHLMTLETGVDLSTESIFDPSRVELAKTRSIPISRDLENNNHEAKGIGSLRWKRSASGAAKRGEYVGTLEGSTELGKCRASTFADDESSA
ncbi:hypothetical protein Dsin_014856 [Dipteronia sinensis]|uniref:DUF4283 domain-containing protein n=1 Tax=Dipteronia sinensis TaxID=43782 RepID=A0AAE0AMK4_9ROSI|nr:hypothetical protein Dsin_014856 [Dipteronia sinensis]